MSKFKTITTESDFFEINGRKYRCPFQLTTSVFSGKWKLRIIKTLLDNRTLRYGQLKKALAPGITDKMLIHSLRELEQDGLVKRIMYMEVPPRVEYKLTVHGIRLSHVIEAMNEFGMYYRVPGVSINIPAI